MQNKSHAVMAQRSEAKDSLDDFPTPPWATRALLEHVLQGRELSQLTCLEPACGVGHMAKVLDEYFGEVQSSDVHDYGYGAVRDYLRHPSEINCCDWVITNPPFRLAEEFVLKSLGVVRKGCCNTGADGISGKCRQTREDFQSQSAQHRRSIYRARANGEGSTRQERFNCNWLLLVGLGKEARVRAPTCLDSALP
jgi:hypothetical protein